MPDPVDELPGSVLFACSLNIIRSPIAAGILEHLAGNRIRIASAGVRAGAPDPFAAEIMEEIGIDIRKHKPRAIADIDESEKFDLVISLSPEAHHQALELTRTMPVKVEYWPTFDATAAADPADHKKTLEAYRVVREQLFRRIKQRFPLTGFPRI